MTTRNLFLSMAMLMSMSIQAQQEWDLRRCIDYALAHNVQVRQYEGQVKAQEITVSTVRNSRLPGVNASASQNFNFGRGLTSENTYVNRNTMSTSFGASLSLSVYDGGQTTRNLQVQKLQLQAALADLSRAREDLSLQVTSAYMEVLFQMDLLDVARRQQELSMAQAQRLEKLWRAGKAAESEWADAKALVASDALSLTQTENAYQLALLTLSQLLELTHTDDFTVARPEIVEAESVILPMPDEVMAEALNIKPAIQAGKLRVQSAERNIQLARTSYFPKLSLNAGLGTNYYNTNGMDVPTFGQQMKDNLSYNVGVSLSVPIFDRLYTRNQIRTARVQLSNQQLALEQTRKDMYKEIQQAYQNAVAAQRQCSSARASEEASRAAFALVATKYENGKSTATEYQEAKMRLAKAQSEGHRAKYAFLFRCKILDFYRGMPL